MRKDIVKGSEDTIVWFLDFNAAEENIRQVCWSDNSRSASAPRRDVIDQSGYSR